MIGCCFFVCFFFLGGGGGSGLCLFACLCQIWHLQERLDFFSLLAILQLVIDILCFTWIVIRAFNFIKSAQCGRQTQPSSQCWFTAGNRLVGLVVKAYASRPWHFSSDTGTFCVDKCIIRLLSTKLDKIPVRMQANYRMDEGRMHVRLETPDIQRQK